MAHKQFSHVAPSQLFAAFWVLPGVGLTYAVVACSHDLLDALSAFGILVCWFGLQVIGNRYAGITLDRRFGPPRPRWPVLIDGLLVLARSILAAIGIVLVTWPLLQLLPDQRADCW